MEQQVSFETSESIACVP